MLNRGMLNLLEGDLVGLGTVGGDVNNDGGTTSPGNDAAADPVPEPGSMVLVASVGLVHRGRWENVN